MIRATTAKGTPVWVSLVDDVEPNEGGWYCVVENSETDAWLDDFCIHPEDCDCSNLDEVEKFAQNYVENITEY